MAEKPKLEMVKVYCACGCGHSWMASRTSTNKYFARSHEKIVHMRPKIKPKGSEE